MTARPIIRVGDKTTHGGTVLEGFSSYSIDGRAAAGVGHKVDCPKCNGLFPIIEGVPSFAVGDSLVTLEGMKTACGAALISSQGFARVDPGPGAVTEAFSDATLSEIGRSRGETSPAKFLPGRLRNANCNHVDTAVSLAGFIVQEIKTNPFSVEGRKILSANRANAQARRAEWQKWPWYLRLGGPPDFDGAAAGQKAAPYGMWAERVGPGRPWDHKPILIRMLGQNLNKGWQKYGDHDYYLDIWSNIHYGYVGVVLGFSAAELINGAGLAQAMFDVWTKRIQQNHHENGRGPASADDRPDHISIMLGIELCNEVEPQALTVDMLLGKISAMPVPWGTWWDNAKRPHKCVRRD